MLTLCLIVYGLLTIADPCTAGWMRPRYLNIISHIRDDRCKQFEIFTQKIDHFGFVNMDTFEQRYIINKDYWENGRPIFFYAGNEGLNEGFFMKKTLIYRFLGDIDLFCDNTGFSELSKYIIELYSIDLVWDIAPIFNAMLIFAEHRYYGQSLPYGNASYSKPEYSK
jgi:lysosomal Pro-X carboxypeptidase